MKRLLLGLCLLALTMLLALSLLSCSAQPAVTEAETTSHTVETTVAPDTTEALVNGLPNYIDGKLFIIDDGKTNYQIVYPKNATADSKGGSFLSSALTQIRKAFKNYGHQMITITNDFTASEGSTTGVVSDYEILIGNTNRTESDISNVTLEFNQAVIRVAGKKVVISGNHHAVTAMAVMIFINRYMPTDGSNAVLIPADLNEVITVDFSTCMSLGMSYEEMAEATLAAFNDSYWQGKWVNTGRFWTGAEVLESYIDVYEATGAKKDKEAMVSYANQFIKAWGSTWGGISYNDDLMWGSIAFARLAKLTRDPMYLNIAKQNFDLNWKRAWDDTLGGGLWWRSQKDSKNACVNGPGAIAACLIGELTGDESYYEKAKAIIDWMLAELYVAETGRVIDSYSTSGEKNDYASTYNQGTFIGACTYLYQHYKDVKYLEYAKKSCEYAMTKLATNGILELESNVNNADLPGFKAILIRWTYRYAKETNDIDAFIFIQQNAIKAFQNRNADGLIWTNWGGKTPSNATGNKEYLWGSSTAITLMYSCFPWW